MEGGKGRGEAEKDVGPVVRQEFVVKTSKGRGLRGEQGRFCQ